MSGFKFNHKYKEEPTHQGKNENILGYVESLKDYHAHLQRVIEDDSYGHPESVLRLSSDTAVNNAAQDIKDQFSNDDLQHIVVCGIGGSSRGVQAIYGACASDNTPQLHVLDSLEYKKIDRVVRQLTEGEKNNFVICVVSKSGQTTETIFNFDRLQSGLAEKFGNINDRTVVISTSGSPLMEYGQKQDIKTCIIPDIIPGRFSIFSVAGIVPVALLGFDIQKIREGANSIINVCYEGGIDSDPAAFSASIIHDHINNGFRTINNFFSSPLMERIGKWLEQLYSESLGKQKDRQGKPVFHGLLPITSLPDDLHSRLQLYMGGPRTIFTQFVRIDEKQSDDFFDLPNLLPEFAGKQWDEVHKALPQAVLQSYRERGLPHIEIVLDEINEFHVAQLLQFKMIEVMYLGQLANINAFNQPAVDEYKQNMKNILSQNQDYQQALE